MILRELGGWPPTATLEGTAEEIRGLAGLLGCEVLVISDQIDDQPDRLLTKVNAARIERGLSWRQVAVLVGLSSSSILSRWASGQGSPGARTSARVAAWLRTLDGVK